MYPWPRQGFRFSHKQSMQVEEDSKQLLDIKSLWTRQNKRYKRLFRICDKTKSHVCLPFSHDPDTKPLPRLILIGDLLLLYQP